MRTVTRIALAAGLMGLAACYAPPPPGAVIVAARPPSYREEIVGVAPGPSFFWVAGFWEWGGAEYRWMPGRWVARPYPRAVWVRGRWHSTRRGWFWTPGHWR